MKSKTYKCLIVTEKVKKKKHCKIYMEKILWEESV